MGLLRSIALLPLAPIRGVVWVAEQITEQAERELYDPGVIRRQLGELEAAFEAGEIDQEEFDVLEGRLLDRLAGPGN